MRFLALDVGTVRIGIAVCDILEISAYPLATVTRSGSLKRDIATIAAFVAEQEADAVVVGLPLSLDGEIGTQAMKVQGFAKALGTTIDVPMVMWDESLSSVDAEEILISQGVSREKRRQRIDQTAAAVILESYLAHRRATNKHRDTFE